MGGIVFKAILGMAAGIAAWAIAEPFKPGFENVLAWQKFELVLFSLWGSFIGGAVGFANGYSRGSKMHMLREFGLGAVFGLIGILIGRGISTPFAAMIGTPLTMIGRTGAFACFGAALGGAIGFNTFVPRRALQGLIGGGIGGAIAGSLFDPVAGLLAGITLVTQGVQAGALGEIGGPSRALTGALLGGAIAMMIGIVEALSKSVWLRLELGRNEGKEWVLDKPTMTLGRSERADIPLFGDPNVAPLHAVIQKRGAAYVVVDQGSPIGTGVNGQRIQEAFLNPNDVVQLGGMNLRFLSKNVAAPARGPVDQMRPHQPIQPIQIPVPTQAKTPSPFQVLTPTLVCLDGPMMGRRYPVNAAIEIGRESVQLPIPYDQVASRRHALVELRGTDVVAKDLGSTNGTFVNGQRITEASLKMGDILKVGNTSFRIES